LLMQQGKDTNTACSHVDRSKRRGKSVGNERKIFTVCKGVNDIYYYLMVM